MSYLFLRKVCGYADVCCDFSASGFRNPHKIPRSVPLDFRQHLTGECPDTAAAMFKQRDSSTTAPGTPIYTYNVCAVVEQKKQQNLGNAILLENSWTPLLQNPMVRSAYKLPAWKPNRNSLVTPAVAEMVDAKVPPQAVRNPRAVCMKRQVALRCFL